MPFAINTAPEVYQIRQTEHVSDLLVVVVIADCHLVFACGNAVEKACKDHDNSLRGLLKEPGKLG